MASVTSLDQDMRKLRMDRYTPQAANEIRSWIEMTLGESLKAGDLLESLKDGVALCKLANLILAPPGIKYKASSMPFTQRENISHFLTACEREPLNLPAHDRFLTVDLYDNKDPAQVIQCIGAFSRAANAVNPSIFPTAIGPKRQASPVRKPATNSPASNGNYNRGRATSNTSQRSTSTADGKRALSPAFTDTSGTSRSTGTVSSWSKKTDETSSAPAWNIHQYGYMGGASQGNQGISFGSRRQITSPGVSVPSLAEKEKRRNEEAEAEAQRSRAETAWVERRRREELDNSEREAKIAEEQRHEEETIKARYSEKQRVEEQRRRWEEEELRWKEEEERRRRDEEIGGTSPVGGYLTQREVEEQNTSSGDDSAKPESSNDRIRELERQLEEAKERERQYQLERERRRDRELSPQPFELSPESPEKGTSYRRPQSVSLNREETSRNPSIYMSSYDQEQPWTSRGQHLQPPSEGPSFGPSRPLPNSNTIPYPRTLPQPADRLGQPLDATFVASILPSASAPITVVEDSPSPTPLPRPLPEPSKSPLPPLPVSSSPFNRTDRFLFDNKAPQPAKPRSHFPSEMGMSSSSERAAEDARRIASQDRTKAGGWASKSLLEREMERERERQKEWEEAQMGKGKIMGPRELKR